MVKESTAKLERQKKAKKTSTSSSGPPPGWIQGDWLPSRVSKGQILELVEDGLVPKHGWRLPEADEMEPEPRPDERVLLVTHIKRGFSMLPSPFFRGFLNYFGAQLHHLPPNTVVYLSAFVSLCENFIGCHPYWGLFMHIFTCRSMTVKKPDPDGGKTNVIQQCGGLGIQLRGKSAFPSMSFSDTVKSWQNSWFYCTDVPSADSQIGLPPYSAERIGAPPSLKLAKEEKVEVGILVEALVGAMRSGVDGMDLLEAFRRQIQPLQERVRPMWKYEGPSDPTRVHPEDLSESAVEDKIKAITSVRDNPQGARRVAPYDREHPPAEGFEKMVSLAPNADHAPADVASDTEQHLPEEPYEEESDDEEESSGESDEAESSPSDSAPKEIRSKKTQDPSAHVPVLRSSKSQAPTAPAPSARNTKRGRSEPAESEERASKQPKQVSSKPRKAMALPKIKMTVPIASTVATSSSPDPNAAKGQTEADTADAATSKENL